MSLTDSAAPSAARADRNDLNSLYAHLRVCDVADALDGIGYFDLTLMSPEVRPLWSGMKFWGQAATKTPGACKDASDRLGIRSG